MKRWIRFAAKLYPRAWRERYGPEFDALLDQSPGGFTEFADVTRGALTMNLTHRKLPQLFVLAGFATGLAFWALRPRQYDAAVMLPFDDAFRDRAAGALSRNALSGVIQRNGLYRSERTREPMEEVVEQMRSQIRIIRATDSSARLEFRYTDAHLARQVSAELAAALGGANVSPVITEAKTTPWIPIGVGLAGGILAAFLLLPEARRTLTWGTLSALLIYGASWALPDRYLSTAVVRGDPSMAAANATRVERRGPLSVVAIEHSDPRTAQRELESALRQVAPGKIIDPPSYPQTPISPNRNVLAGGGMAAGILLRMWRGRTP